MAGKGGRIAGAGRKPGALTKKTRAIATSLGAEGITPLEVLVSGMRIAWGKSLASEHTDREAFAAAIQCAEKAAPFMHAKLATVQHEGKVDGNLTVVIRRFFADPAAKS